MPRLIKWLAAGGGLGYLPKAPGTAGSVLGFLLGWWWPLAGWSVSSCLLVLGVVCLGALICTRAERLFQRHDPSCIVLDEIIGMWLVMAVASPRRYWIIDTGSPHAPLELAVMACDALLAFGLFRLFDIVKPAPLPWLARAPEGWGILLDDLGAGLYTLLSLGVFRLVVAIVNGSFAWWFIHR